MTSYQRLASFAAIGAMSTLAYLALYALLRSWLPAAPSNAIALVVTAIANTAANRRLTFGVRGGEGLGRDLGAGLAAFAIALAITSASVAVLGRLAPGGGRPVELAVLAAANLLATGCRFLLLRRWIGGRAPAYGSELDEGAVAAALVLGDRSR